MQSNHQCKNPLGIFFIILGAILFLGAAGEFLLRLLFALLALWLIAYGIRLVSGRPVFYSMFWQKRE